MSKIFEKLDKIDGVTVLLFLSFSSVYGANVDIFPKKPIVVNEGTEFEVVCKNLSPKNAWNSLQFIVEDGTERPVAISFRNGSPCNMSNIDSVKLGPKHFSCNYTVFVLTVFKASFKADGLFIGCRIATSDGVAENNYTTIKIKEPLSGPDVESIGKQAIVEHTSKEFRCTAKSYPPSDIVWYINNRQLLTRPSSTNFNISSSSLIYKASKKDDGQYLYCAASNEYESANSSMLILDITYLPIVSIYPTSSLFTVVENTTNFKLNCDVTGANPIVTSFNWYKNGSTIATFATYTILTVNRTDSGIYTCDATNSIGTTLSSALQLNVLCRDMYALKEENNSMFSAGIASLVVGLLFFIAAITFIFRKRLKKNDTKSHQSNDYADLHVSNPAFQDQYTSLQNPIVSMETSAYTYDDCEHASDVAAYPNVEVTISGQNKAEKNEGIYDNVKI